MRFRAFKQEKEQGWEVSEAAESSKPISKLHLVVWVPDANLLGVEYSGAYKADETLRSIEDFVPEHWGLPPYPAEVQN